MVALSTQFVLPFASALLLLAAALSDLAWRIIPNRIPVLVACLGLVSQFIIGDPVSSLIGAAIVFAMCAFLWRLHVIGGGDVKLLAAVALCVPPGNLLGLYMAISLTGTALGLLYLLLRPVMRRLLPGLLARPSTLWRRVMRVESWRIGRGRSLPYGIAIAAGTTAILLQGINP
jgi:prepilin peptidase CpaA